MNIKLEKVEENKKEILYRLLEFSLYDGSNYVDNIMENDGVFKYKYFDDYFKDKDREAYFIKYEKKLVGFTMINKYLKVLPKESNNYSVAEFLIIPKYRRLHIGREATIKLFNLHKGNWEVQPMENNKIAYKFWGNVINSYTNGNYELKHFDNMEDVFVFSNKEII